MRQPVQQLVLSSLLLFGLAGVADAQEDVPLAPPDNRRPTDWQPPDNTVDREALMQASETMRVKSAQAFAELQAVNAQGKWKPTAESVQQHPTPEWFKDAKFGMFIDYGPWSIGGWAPKSAGQMLPDWYEISMYKPGVHRAYHEKNWGADFERDDFLPLFTAEKYDPDALIQLAVESGMKYVVPFCKHHAGYSLWPSEYTFRDAGDVGPKRDLIAPLARQARANNLKFGFYLSVEEWEYPQLDEKGQLVVRRWGGKTEPYTPDLNRKMTGKIPVKDYASQYLVPQAKEFIDAYDPDILWYDGEWQTRAESMHTYAIASYLYNKAQGRKEVAVNDRFGAGTRSKIGDFYTSEFGHMGDQSQKEMHAWEECRGISQSYGYNWQDTEENVLTAKQLTHMFVDIVAGGGNLLLMVNLDGKGALPKVQEDRLRDIGRWLKVNGEGIYATRPYAHAVPALSLDHANWIWFPEGDPAVGAPIESRYFRQTFSLAKDRAIRDATCIMMCDDQFTLYVNGKQAGQGKRYNDMQRIDVKQFLQQGQNLLAVQATNAPTQPAEKNPAGLIGLLHIEFEQGEPMTIVTDGDWKVAMNAPDGWETTDVKDIDWSAARNLGPYGKSPWGKPNPPHETRTDLAMTQSKDGKHIYVILKSWPGTQLKLSGIQPAAQSEMTLLGYDKPLKWTLQDSQVTIELPEELQDPNNRPCEHAWVLKIEPAAKP